jgi:hypothetical protein
MGRTKHPTTALDAPVLTGPAELRAIDEAAAGGGQALDAQALLREILDVGASDALMAAGGIRMAVSLATVADSAVLAIYDRLRETKAYRKLPSKSGDVSPLSLDEFCQEYLGRSARRLRELSANRRLLGEDLFASAEHLGFKERDYRLIKALPDDDREAVKLAIEQAQQTGDQDAALAVLAEFAARQRAAREAAEAERDVAQQAHAAMEADYLASNRLLGETKTRLRRIEDGGEVPQLDVQMASWPTVSGSLTGEIRAHLTRLGLMIQDAERRIADVAPQPDTPAHDVVERACRSWYDQLGADLDRLGQELLGVQHHLDRVVGAFACPGADPAVPGEPVA